MMINRRKERVLHRRADRDRRGDRERGMKERRRVKEGRQPAKVGWPRTRISRMLPRRRRETGTYERVVTGPKGKERGRVAFGLRERGREMRGRGRER